MPMLGDDPYTGWASGYSDPLPAHNPELLAQFNANCAELEEQGYIRVDLHGSELITPYLAVVKQALQRLAGVEKWQDEFSFADTTVKVTWSRGFFSKLERITLQRGDRTASMTEAEAAAFIGEWELVPRYHAPEDKPARFVPHERVLTYIQRVYAGAAE